VGNTWSCLFQKAIMIIPDCPGYYNRYRPESILNHRKIWQYVKHGHIPGRNKGHGKTSFAINFPTQGYSLICGIAVVTYKSRPQKWFWHINCHFPMALPINLMPSGRGILLYELTIFFSSLLFKILIQAKTLEIIIMKEVMSNKI